MTKLEWLSTAVLAASAGAASAVLGGCAGASANGGGSAEAARQSASEPPGQNAPEPSVRVLRTLGPLTLVSYAPRGLERLSAAERVLVYHLSAAAMAGDGLYTRQTSRFAYPAWQLVQQLAARADRLPPALREAVLEHRRWLFVFHGLHDPLSGRKYLPPIERQTFTAALAAAGIEASAELLAALFDPDVAPALVNKTPGAGKDPLVESAANHYEGLTSRDLEGYKETFPLNGRLVQRGGRIVEEVYRAGSEHTPAGLGAAPLRRVIHHLTAAQTLAPPEQRRALGHLIHYFESGASEQFEQHDIAWLAQTFPVDYFMGFLPSYADVRSRKGDFSAFVGIPDPDLDPPLRALAQSAAYFEARLPWPEQYRRHVFRPPAIGAMTMLAAAGTAAPITFGGINLPDAADLRERYGTKNFINVSAEAARRHVLGSAFIDEYAPPDVRGELIRCRASLDTAFVGLHELTGHGSGSVSPRLAAPPMQLLSPHYWALEEARADLVASYLALDPKVVEIGLFPDTACARIFPAANALRLLVAHLQVPHGDGLEEDHLRGMFLQLGVLHEKGALRFERQAGKSYLVAADLDAWHRAVAQLLSELQRIKATGDAPALERLIRAHATHLDPTLRDEIVARRPPVSLPERVALLPPLLSPIRDRNGRIVDATATQISSLDEYIGMVQGFDGETGIEPSQ